MAVSEWDHRQLCPDGACTGIIGQDGTCKVCGRVAPDWGDERRRGLIARTGDDGEGEGEAGDDDEQDELSPSAPAVLGEVAEWHRRQLCSDGACVGVIGADGKCKVCGKPASASEGDEEEEEEEDADEDADEGDEDEDEGEEDQASAEGDEEGEEDEEDEEKSTSSGDDDRKLCPDGACIGVIGPDGRCKVCGKEAV